MDLTQRYDPELVAALQAFPIGEMINQQFLDHVADLVEPFAGEQC